MKPWQRKDPCGDCPWRRCAAPGWLGDMDVAEWLGVAHSESTAECHVEQDDLDCAGIAIYRANVCKRPRDPNALRLPADRENVFARPNEFRTHHETPIGIEDAR